MIAIYAAAREVTEFLEAQGWRFCVIGGLAVQQWGEPRTTRDADFALLVGWGNEVAFIRRILSQFEARIEDAETFALKNRVLLIRASNKVDVDISLAALEFEEQMIGRSREIKFDKEVHLPCCTAEDLFIMKAFASRVRDWTDVEGIVARQEHLDVEYILGHLSVLCGLLETPETLSRAKDLLEQHR